MYRFMAIIVILAALTILSFPAAAQEPPVTLTFNFQGRLSNALGEPVPDGNYQVRLLIYADSVGGTPLWNELHPAVPIEGGFFNINAGSVVPCTLSIPSLPNIFLATQIASEPPMARRFRIASAPTSGVARRIYGDLRSSPGSLMLSNPVNSHTAIALNAEGDETEQAGMTINFSLPPDPFHGSSLALGAGATQAGLEVMSIPPDPWHQMSAGINVDSGQAQVNLNDMVTGSGVNLNTGPASAALELMTVPPDPWHQMSAGINVDSSQAQLNLGDMVTGSGVSLNTGPASAALELMVVPPEPWHQMSLGINVDSGQAQVNLEDMVTGSGISLNTGSETMGIVIEERPSDTEAGRRFFAGVESGEVGLGFEGPNGQRLFDVSGMPGSVGSISWRMFNPQPEPPGDEGRLMMEGTSNPGGSISWSMFNPQPEPPGHPGLSMEVGSSGPDFRLFAPQIGGAALANNHPQIKMLSDVSTSSLLLQRAFSSVEGDDSIGVLVRADSSASEMRFFKGGATHMKISTNSGGTSMSFFDDGTRYMGVDGVPWHAGGDLTMYDATGGVTLLLASNGMASIGTGNHTNILTIRQNAPADPIADAWTTYSSRRWKTNIQPLQGALDKVLRLNGVSYDEIDGGKHNIGLIAEDVGQVVPEVVAYEENGVDAKSVDYAKLVTLLIEGMKEQQKTIEQLKSEINELKIR